MSKIVTDILLTKDPLSMNNVISKISHPACGGLSIFVGTTRNHHDGKKVVKLEYECYSKMAKKQIQLICDDTRSKWPDVQNIAVHHRLGHVPVMDMSVIIGISSPHREDAISASKHCIEKLKANVPIWKREIYEDGSEEWQENKECDFGKT
ncbi:molybdopterin synthase catalytic subunit-like [Styela clava]